MRPVLTTAALWLVVAIAAALGGAATVLATGTTTTPVLTPDQVAEELARQDPPATGGDADPPKTFTDDDGWTMPTPGGNVTVICSGDIIAAETVTAASGWKFDGPEGTTGKHHVVFTVDGSTAKASAKDGHDTLAVAYTCRDGQIAWDTKGFQR